MRDEHFWSDLTLDLRRYCGEKPWSAQFLFSAIRQAYIHPGLIAIIVYRYGRWTLRNRIPVVRELFTLVYALLFTFVRLILHIEIPRSVVIGPGLRIDHFGGIIINNQVSIGANLTMTHGVIIGQSDTGIPILRDNVGIGIGAKIIGGIVLEDGVIVGAGAVVTKSFPAYAIVAGVPAKLLRIRDPEIRHDFYDVAK
ncbi:MAG: hypothetical protein H7308_08935 [Chthonomonadaceae bacterium]|nr:hypothetical protein [Chthonomonadaceae bacterium]